LSGSLEDLKKSDLHAMSKTHANGRTGAGHEKGWGVIAHLMVVWGAKGKALHHTAQSLRVHTLHCGPFHKIIAPHNLERSMPQGVALDCKRACTPERLPESPRNELPTKRPQQ